MWHQIAREQELVTPAAKEAFHMSAEQLARQDDIWVKLEEEAGTPPEVARCLPTLLPQLLESAAINGFVERHPSFRGALREILDPEKAVICATEDCCLSLEDQQALTDILSSSDAAQARCPQPLRGL